MLLPTKLAVNAPKPQDEKPEFPSDEEIVQQVLAGDRESFEIIMRRCNQRLFRVARSILDNDAESEDVLQETYVRAFEHLDQFAGRSKFSTWLTRIAVREATRRRRRSRRLRFLDPTAAESLSMSPHAEDNDAETEASRGELREVLSQSLETLPPSLRAVLVLRLVEGLDTDEAAECLGLTPGNVRIRLLRARSLLRQRIDERIGEEARQLYQFDGERCDRIVRAVMQRVTPLSFPAR